MSDHLARVLILDKDFLRIHLNSTLISKPLQSPDLDGAVCIELTSTMVKVLCFEL